MSRTLFVLLAFATFAWPADAARVAGGGSPRTDCFLELDVKGAHRLSTRAAECTDGDPACDLDGQCDGACRLGIAVCLNQADPALPNCNPPAPPLPLLQANERGRNPVGLDFPSFAGSACGAFASVDVPVTRRARIGRRVITVAVSPTRPRRDRDVLRLFCRARPGGCPTTTTTVTTNSTTTTSTTLPGTALSIPASADTGIFSGSPDGALGNLGQVFVGNDATNAERGLLRFDLSGVPAAAAVASCAIELNVVTLNEAGPGAIHRVKQPLWNENASWNRFDGVSPWTTPGAFDPAEASSDVVVTGGPDGPVAYAAPDRTGTFTLPDVTSLCVDAIANRGGRLDVMLKQDTDAPGATAELSFSRRTDSEDAERPRLRVGLAP